MASIVAVCPIAVLFVVHGWALAAYGTGLAVVAATGAALAGRGTGR